MNSPSGHSAASNSDIEDQKGRKRNRARLPITSAPPSAWTVTLLSNEWRLPARGARRSTCEAPELGRI